MSEDVYCLDSGVLIKVLMVEEPTELTGAARQLLRRAIANGRLVAPAFAWAEVGSVLRKKVRQGLLSGEEARELWEEFGRLPIEYVEFSTLRSRAWEIAEAFELPTLYDASFLACVELASASPEAAREFWTADEALIRSLGNARPAYVRNLATATRD